MQWVPENRIDHTLIIGGTGMLADAAAHLSKRSKNLTSVAGTKRSLSKIDLRIAKDCTHHSLQLNWNKPDEFLNRLRLHLGELMPPTLVLAWFHDNTLGPRTAELIERSSAPCRFFQVLGSATADPRADASKTLEAYRAPAHVVFHRVVLGFVETRSGSRWLTDSEISSGVLESIESGDEYSVVGCVEPWSSRP